MKTSTKDFPALVRRIRKERGLSQVDVAARAGISPSTYRALEYGYRENIAMTTTFRVMDALGYRIMFVRKEDTEE